MANIDHERVLTLKEATRGQNPKTFISVRVEDLDYLTAAVLDLSPAPTEQKESPAIDGGFTKEAKKDDDSSILDRQ